MIVPLVVFFALGMLIDTSPLRDGESVNAAAYFVLTAGRVVLMAATLLFFAREILRQFPLRIGKLGWGVGIIGGVLWIGLCRLGLEQGLLETLGLAEDWLPSRAGVNPFATYAAGVPLAAFLAFRFLLLVLCVPIAEELFLRGFLMRAMDAEDWPSLSLQDIGRTGLVMGTVYGVATHPAEWVAAAVWFTMVTWLMVKTGRFWDCVLAHAVTNLILGLYVCHQGQWHLW
jgi:CAAX prenyl protease-like protein